MNANAIGIIVRKAFGLVMVVEALREITSLADVDERMVAIALSVNFTPGDYVHATNGLEFCAPGMRLEAVLFSGVSRKSDIRKFRHRTRLLSGGT